MNKAEQSTAARSLRNENCSADLVVVGGGLSGVCCAITAARSGLQVVLVQDRPVLGGNASSEVRLWVLGATSHMGNNNRWAREGGVIDEILVENLWRNPEGNPVLVDALILEFVSREPNIRLLLNTAVSEAEMNPDGSIRSVGAFCSQNQIHYCLVAPLFCDASGDGILGYLSGAEFRMGAEARSEFGEALAPPVPTHDLLGHSLYFYSRDTGKPVHYVPPAFALQDITQIPRYRELSANDSGCRLWWLEYGGALDTVFQTEEIKWELWRVGYGVWNYIKNSGQFPEAENLTLEWMGMIPGKRESRRFVGDLILTQQDVVEQRKFPDAVSFGGWAIDLHPSEGVFSPEAACVQWHSKGVYQIPFRTMYSRNVPNLFLTGRILSASHIAFGSTRVMATCAHNGQAVGMAAAICTERSLRPRDLNAPESMNELQQRLLRAGQFIPHLASTDPYDKARQATVSASSTLRLRGLERSGETLAAEIPIALLVPLPAGDVCAFTYFANAAQDNTLFRAELWIASRDGNTTPDVQLSTFETALPAGKEQRVEVRFPTTLARACHAFVVIRPTPGLSLAMSRRAITGVLTVANRLNKAVAKNAVQTPPPDSGIDSFPFWLPERRPSARNLAVEFDPPLAAFEPDSVINGIARPWMGVNAWIPAEDDPAPALRLRWRSPQTLHTIEIAFDTDFDHPMESVLRTHPERVMPACVTAFDVIATGGQVLAQMMENHQTRWKVTLPEPVRTDELQIRVRRHGPALPAIFEVRCYS